MKKYKVFLNGYVTYITDKEDRAIALAEQDIKHIHSKFNLDISGIKDEDTETKWESVGIYPLEVSEEE